MIEPYPLAGTVSPLPAGAVATKRKSRREGSAAEIVVTVSILVRLAGGLHPRCEPPTLSASSRPRETEGAGPAADCSVRFQPGGDQKQRNPAAVYWHPYRRSASMPTNAAARLQQPPCKAQTAPCALPSINRISRRTPGRFCACAPASALKRTSWAGWLSHLRPRVPPRRQW